MIVWMVADRALDIIGLGTLCYWTWKIARWRGWGRREKVDV
jgi:hypothetical protein